MWEQDDQDVLNWLIAEVDRLSKEKAQAEMRVLYWKVRCDELRAENKELLWANEEQLQALADIINAVASETNALNRARLILAKARGEVDDE